MFSETKILYDGDYGDTNRLEIAFIVRFIPGFWICNATNPTISLCCMSFYNEFYRHLSNRGTASTGYCNNLYVFARYKNGTFIVITVYETFYYRYKIVQFHVYMHMSCIIFYFFAKSNKKN